MLSGLWRTGAHETRQPGSSSAEGLRPPRGRTRRRKRLRPSWGSSEISIGYSPSMNSPQTFVSAFQKRRKGSGPARCKGRVRCPSALYFIAKSSGTTSTVWSGWKWVKKIRSTAKGSRSAWSIPRTEPEPRSKSSVSPPASTATQLWRLARRGTTVPDPTTLISIKGYSLSSPKDPGDPDDTQQGTSEYVRGPEGDRRRGEASRSAQAP